MQFFDHRVLIDDLKDVSDVAFIKKRRMGWAALIRKVYEVNPLRCPGCGREFFVAFSYRQRCCCPSCDQKRALLPGMRLAEEVLAPVSHRQWVLTIPKRLRIFFRYDRRLLGQLCRLTLPRSAWE